MLGKRLINSNDAAAGGSCTTNTNDYPTTNVAYYKMSSAADEKGTYNGTASNVNFNVQGKFGNAAEFNGSTSSILLPNTMFNTSGVLSVSVWFKTTETNGYGIVLANRNGTHTFFIELYPNGTLQAGNWQGGTYNISTTSTVNDGNWHHYAYVNNSGAISVYLDGVLENTGTQTFLNQTYTNGNQIGNYDINNSEAFDGSIDQVRIFSSALNATQVTQLYNEVYCVPTIVPSDNFNAVLYTGIGTSKSVTGVGFQPDLVWGKARDSGALSHILFDVVRGENRQISSDLTDDEVVRASAAYEFDLDGFTVTTAGNLNNPNDFVAWCWKAGGAAVSNTDGTITSQVSADVDAGFSIVTNTSPTGAYTWGHGLSKTPELWIHKATNYTYGWETMYPDTFGQATGSNNPSDWNRIFLNTTAAATTNPVYSATDTVLSSTGWGLVSNFVTYCFHSVDGFSKIGSYTGTGATGNTIVTGFRPAFVMIKQTSSIGADNHWNMWDNKRVQYDMLRADTYGSEFAGTLTRINFLSNGFKMMDSDTSRNASGGTYIFMAFAEEALPYVTRNATDPFGDSSELALYKFEDNATNSEDSVTASTTGTSYVAGGYINKGINIPAGTSEVTTSYTTNYSNLTWSAWVKYNTLPTSNGDATIFQKGFYTSASNTQYLHLRYEDYTDRFKFAVRNNSAYNSQADSGISATTGVWYHVVGTLSSSGVAQIYVNGVAGTSITGAPTMTNSNPLRIGGQGFNNSAQGDVIIDQVRIFNRVLDDGEVTALYNE